MLYVIHNKYSMNTCRPTHLHTLAVYGIHAVRHLAFALHTWDFASLPSAYIQVVDMLRWSYHSVVLTVGHDQHAISQSVLVILSLSSH